MSADVAARDEVVDRLRAREVEELARIDERRTRDPDVHLLAAERVELRGLLRELRAADDRIVAERETAVLDEAFDRDELHRRDVLALLLLLRHERARPARKR